jgi:hypothetical protein
MPDRSGSLLRLHRFSSWSLPFLILVIVHQGLDAMKLVLRIAPALAAGCLLMGLAGCEDNEKSAGIKAPPGGGAPVVAPNAPKTQAEYGQQQQAQQKGQYGNKNYPGAK